MRPIFQLFLCLSTAVCVSDKPTAEMEISELLTRPNGWHHQYVAATVSQILHFKQYSEVAVWPAPFESALRWSAPRLPLFSSVFSSWPVCLSGVNIFLLRDRDAQLAMSWGELLHTWARDRSWLALPKVVKDKNSPKLETTEKCHYNWGERHAGDTGSGILTDNLHQRPAASCLSP